MFWRSFFFFFWIIIIKGPASGERFCEDLHSVNGVTYLTFKDASHALGLLDSNKEWNECLTEASHWATDQQLRALFVMIFLFCQASNPFQLWKKNWILIYEDIVYKQRQVLQFDRLQISKSQIKNIFFMKLNSYWLKVASLWKTFLNYLCQMQVFFIWNKIT